MAHMGTYMGQEFESLEGDGLRARILEPLIGRDSLACQKADLGWRV